MKQINFQQTTDRVTVLEPGPSLTMENAHELLHLIKSVTNSHVQNFVVNMGRTKVLDSTGVGVLVSSMKLVRQRNGVFVLAHLAPEVLRVLEQMNLLRSLQVFETVELASQQLAVHTKSSSL